MEYSMATKKDENRWKGNNQEPIQSNSKSCPKQKGTQTIKTTLTNTEQAESQGVRSVPTYGHMHFLKMNKCSKTNTNRMNNDN